jgi:hypothetical protein
MTTDTTVEGTTQVDQTLNPDQGGADQSQVGDVQADGQRGAEGDQTQTAPPPRTYTEAEYREAQAAADKRVQDAQEALARQSMEREIEKAQQLEREAQAADRRAVEDGEITEADAQRNAQHRLEMVQEQQTLAELKRTNRQLAEALEPMGKLAAAYRHGAEAGVDPQLLFNDPTLKTPDQMIAKAEKLKAERLEMEIRELKNGGGETFYSGVGTSMGSSIANMTPQEKIAYGLSHPPKRR